MYEATTKRNLVHVMCLETKPDIEAAVKLTESIEDEWYRIQSYASIIDICPQYAVEIYVGRIAKSARSAQDAYRSGAIAWAIAACGRRGDREFARGLIQVVLDRAPQIRPMNSRAEALYHVWCAQFPLGWREEPELLEALIGACVESGHWRAQRNLHDIALMLANESPEIVARILDRFPHGSCRRQTEGDLKSGKIIQPTRY